MIQVKLPIDCPLCPGVQHASFMRLEGIPAIACPAVTPVGAMVYRNSPKPNGVWLVGAGIGVDQEPPRELTVEEMRAQLAAAEQHELQKKAEEKAAKDEADVRAKFQKLQKNQGGA